MKKNGLISLLSALILTAFLAIAFILAHAHRQSLSLPPSSAPATLPPSQVRPRASQPVPAEFFQEASPAGRVETFSYQTRDYTQASPSAITKTALVYLPPGYDDDPATRYDIIYWLHGWQMTNREFLTLGDAGTPHLLDHLINSGRLSPVIVVSLTFDRDNSSQDYDRSIEEITAFRQEVRADLLPAVESHYRTFAADTTPAGLAASRLHRAFSGFSLGAVATWYEFESALDLFAYFVPISGDSWTITQNGGYERTWETADVLERTAQAGPHPFLIIQTNGTKDIFYRQIDSQLMELMRRHQTFTPDRLVYFIKPEGEHDMIAIWEMVYNAFPLLFRLEIAS